MKHSCVGLCIALALAVMGALAPSAQALVPDGTQGWFWQMPQPPGDFAGLSAIASPDAADIWAVGAGSLILHSSDGGATWTAQSSPTTGAGLLSVSFPDSQHGWACGDQTVGGQGFGVILATSDGGASWVDVTPTGLAESLTNASFVDAKHGWIGTYNGEILKTSNGGASWTHLQLSSRYRSGYRDVDFVDAGHGWAGGAHGQMWRTENGGKSWMNLSGGLNRHERVLQLDFVDASHGWALVLSEDSGASQVLRTSDGGLEWHQVATGDPSVGYLGAASASSAWLLGGGAYGSFGSINPFFLGFDGVSTVTVHHTTDGGAHWATSSVGSPTWASALAANGDAVCVVGGGILTSSDAGATWRSASSGQQYLFMAGTALSANDVWAVDASGALLHSTDGSRWVEQPSLARWANVLFGISFPDANDGWVVGTTDIYGDGSVILHTSDGGASWSPQTSNLAGELVGVDFVDTLNGWAISDDSWGYTVAAPLTAEHTTDGGATWLPQYVYHNASLFAVDFVNDTTGWATGDYQPSANSNGLPGIFASTDGGTTWSRERLPVGAPDMTGLQFLDADNGWAAGTSYDQNGNPQQGWILHTTNGGKIWTRVDGLDASLPWTVHFSDAQNGWLGGLNGVYATSDGGATWQHVADGYGVTAIAAGDPQHVWALGEGFVASTLDGPGDMAAPVTLVDQLKSWYRTPATITLSANDVGGAGVQSTAYSTNGGATWQTGTSIAVDAPPDHANDGQHTLLYRSTDNAGNQEQTESLAVGIDTLGPACSAPRPSVVDAGKPGILYFMASDATSDVAQATVSIVDSHGRVVRSFVERARAWYFGFPMPYYWLRFTCTLKPGTYRVEVRARDWAGNTQAVIGRNWLRVVRSGAPAVHHPHWPAGLPGSSTGFSSLISHSPRAQRLLHSRGLLPGGLKGPLVPETGRPR